MEGQEQASCSEDPLDHKGRNSFPSWNAFGSGGLESTGKNWQYLYTDLFISIGTTQAEGRKTWCWLFAGFTINSEICVVILLFSGKDHYWPQFGTTPLRGSAWVCSVLVPNI